MALALALITLLISAMAGFGAACQLQAWSLEDAQRARSVHVSPWQPWRLLRHLPAVYWPLPDTATDAELAERGRLSTLVGWALVYLSAFLAANTGTVLVIIEAAKVGFLAFGLLACVVGLLLLPYVVASWRHGERAAAKWACAGAVLVLFVGAALLSIS